MRAPPPPPEPPRAALRAERADDKPRRPAPKVSGLRRAAFLIAGAIVLIVGLWEISGRGVLNPSLAPATDAAAEIAVATAAVYVSLRAINAALSAAQEVEIGASIGAQASLQPLKVLEPVDDTVERVASVVFSVAAGAAVASVGFEPVAAIGLIALGVGLVAFALGSGTFMAAGLRLIRLGAALGIILPLVFAGGVWLGELATAPRWDEAMGQLEAVTGDARRLIGGGEEALLDSAGDEPAGMISGFLSAVSGAGDAVQSYLGAARVFTQRADELFNASLTIIGIFMLRMLVLPALLLWSVMAVLRKSVG